jgi:hypothetical protein
MDNLVRAIAEFFAAIFATVGFVGKPRRRAGIRDDLNLITELSEHPDFGRGSWPHQALMNRVALDVARLSGVPTPHKIQWGSVILAVVIGAPLGYWTYTIDRDTFQWYSIFPGTVAVFMGLAILGMVFGRNEDPAADADGEPVINPLAGDVNAIRRADESKGLDSPPTDSGK